MRKYSCVFWGHKQNITGMFSQLLSLHWQTIVELSALWNMEFPVCVPEIERH